MSAPFLPVTCHITTNSPNGKASFHPTTSTNTNAVTPGSNLAYIYSAENPVNLSNNQDLPAHISASKTSPLPLFPTHLFPTHGGSVFTIVDHQPNPDGKPGPMHRTQTLDYAIILSGEVELLLDSGEKRICKAGDCVVQRATMHAWKNLSATEVVRIAFIILSCEKVVVEGKEFGEGLSEMKQYMAEDV